MTAMSPWKMVENRTSYGGKSTCVRECTVRLHLLRQTDNQHSYNTLFDDNGLLELSNAASNALCDALLRYLNLNK